MARLNPCHEKLTDGVGKCSIPMWMNGMPAGFCEVDAYGKQEPGQRRYGKCVAERGGLWIAGYCGGLACFRHGGPKERR